jgi:protoheme IX farnesyltransferase
VSSPGPWLRLTAIGAVHGALIAVISGTIGGDIHRAASFVAVPPLVALVVAARVAHPRLLPSSVAALGLFGAAALVTVPGLHVSLAAAALAGCLVAAVQTFRGAPAPSGALRDYVTLTKPRIMSLLLITGACGMFVGAQGVPPLGDLGLMLVGLALACGGASALNHVLDADIDQLMGKRTRARPVAAGRVPPSRALEFGLALSAFSFVLLASFVNVLTAALALVGNLFYVLVYTRWLKRSTPQNIVIGGAAGAVPPLVGWAAVTGGLSVDALLLFAIVFFWTPPHFWALSLLMKDEYARAGVPMLPVVRGEAFTRRSILLYTVVLVAVTLAPVATGLFGVFYAAAAAVLGGAFVVMSARLLHAVERRPALRSYLFSLADLALLFAAMVVDARVF